MKNRLIVDVNALAFDAFRFAVLQHQLNAVRHARLAGYLDELAITRINVQPPKHNIFSIVDAANTCRPQVEANDFARLGALGHVLFRTEPTCLA